MLLFTCTRARAAPSAAAAAAAAFCFLSHKNLFATYQLPKFIYY